MLILSSLIVQIYLSHGVNLLSPDIVTYHMEAFTNTTTRRSMSVRLVQVPSPDSQEQFTSQPKGAIATMQGTRHEEQDQG